MLNGVWMGDMVSGWLVLVLRGGVEFLRLGVSWREGVDLRRGFDVGVRVVHGKGQGSFYGWYLLAFWQCCEYGR